jgi:ribosomal protein S28E/S33
MLDYQWSTCRDDIGLTQVDTNSNLTRFFEQEVYVPSSYHGTMPNGDRIESGATFLSLRSAYKNDPDYARLEEAYNSGDVTQATWTYHRFWHEGDVLMANGVMASLFPSLSPEADDDDNTTTDDSVKLDTTTVELEVGDTETVSATQGTVTNWASSDESVATVDENGTITGVGEGTATITATGSDGSTATVKVTVTATASDNLWGDANVDGYVKANDLLLLKKHILSITELTGQGLANCDVNHDGNIKANDLLKLKKYILGLITQDALAQPGA